MVPSTREYIIFCKKKQQKKQIKYKRISQQYKANIFSLGDHKWVN